MGHVRDLPQSAKDIPEKFRKLNWAKLGVNVEEDFEPLYCIPKTKTKVVKELREKLAEADELYLATDEDREGESISWHLLEVLKPKVPVKRMVFHEITKDAIQKALQDVREIDFNLVRAQEARRILDRLVGYTISPLVWKKVAYGLSAGRVQSVAVNLICQKELERLRFVEAQYSGVAAHCEKDKQGFEAKLLSSQGQRIATGKDFDPHTGKLVGQNILHLMPEAAEALRQMAQKTEWLVQEVEEKPVSRKPAPPFITSTLQQEANRKLGMSARQTMTTAQKLYEQGFITYMRTDSTFLSQEALQAARERIVQRYGKKYLPAEPRVYAGKKVKGAQEAHEAIRPAGTEMILPEDLSLGYDEARLYEMIWKRTVASQMVNSQQKQVSAKFQVGDSIFTASGQTIEFAGFLKVYVESLDENSEDEKETQLPPMKKGDRVKCVSSEVTNHETKPPARYTEASLVQTLEKEGIGRPSTYASILSTIQDRGYVNKQGNALVPTFTAMIVSKLLSAHLSKYVDNGFTSQMEQSLDDIASGDLDSTSYLNSFYKGKTGLLAEVEKNEKQIDADEARTLKFPMKGLKDLSFKVGRYGAYVCRPADEGELCASLPDSQAPADITPEVANKLIDQKVNGADALGVHPKTQQKIYVLNGRFGPYIQMGEVDGEGETKPKRSSLPQGMTPEQVDLPTALFLIDLPKTLGQHPDLNKDIKVGIGRFGPYVVCDGDFRSVPKAIPLNEVDLNIAMEILSQPKKGRGKAAPLKEFKLPNSEEILQVLNGKYGPYVKLGKTNASLAEGMTPETLTLEQALQLIAARGGEVKAKGAASKKNAKASAKVAEKGATKVQDNLEESSAAKNKRKTAPAKGKAVSKGGTKAELLKVTKVVTRKRK